MMTLLAVENLLIIYRWPSIYVASPYPRLHNHRCNQSWILQHCIIHYQKKQCRASLVAQWLGVCLPMQGTQVRALVWEDPTCRGATRPVSHNY